MVLIGRASSMEIQQKHIPQLRFPEFLNDGEWEVKRLGEIAESFTGLTYSPEQVVENGGTLVLRSSNIKNGVLSFEDNVYVQMDIPERVITHIGDLLICVRNGSKNLIGKSAVITKEAENTAFGAFMTVLRAKEGTDQEFLNFLWQSDMIQNQILRNLGSTINQITSKDLNGYKVIVPPLAEQRRIAACLSALDEMLAATNEKLEQMKAYKKGLMQKLFPAKGKKLPELRFKEFEKDGEWTVKGLGEFVDVFQGYGFPERMQGKTRGKYPFIKVSDISMTVNNGGKYIDVANNYVDEEDLPILGATPFPFGTIVFAKIGEAIRLNRRVILSKPSLIDNNVGGVKAKDGLSNDDFVFYIMSMIDLVKYAGGVVPAVKKTTIENIEVLMPPTLDEQQKIAEVLTSIDRTIMQKTKKTNLLKKYKKGLMQQMFPTSK